MKLKSIPHGLNHLFYFLVLLLFTTTAFSQFTETLNQQKFNILPNSEFIGSKLRTIPRIYVDQSKPTINLKIPTADIAKPVVPVVSTSELEKQAFDLLNKRRVENGLEPIVWNDEVAKIARIHSQNMAKNNFFSHQGLDGLMVNDRADSNGLRNWRRIGENIAYNRGYDDPVEFAVLRWMQSQSHRENLLSNKWKETGVGVAIAPDGKTYYFTQVFVLRK